MNDTPKNIIRPGNLQGPPEGVARVTRGGFNVKTIFQETNRPITWLVAEVEIDMQLPGGRMLRAGGQVVLEAKELLITVAPAGAPG